MRMFTPFALLAALCMPAVGLAQQPGATTPQLDNQQQTPADNTLERTQRREAGFRGTGNSLEDDRAEARQELVNYLAAKFYLANQCQIELAEMASSQAQSQDVKNLANDIKQSHQQANQKLVNAMPQLKNIEKLSASDSNSNSPNSDFASRNANSTDRTGTVLRDRVQSNERNRQMDRTNRTSRSLSSSGQDPIDGAAQQLLDIERRAIENNHKLTKQMVTDKQGKQFDMCYLGAVIGSHHWMHSELNAIQNVNSPQFTQIVDEADNKIQQHLGTAKELAKKMQDQQSGERSTSNSNDARDSYRN